MKSMYTRFSQKKTILVENEPFIYVWKNILTVVHIIYNLHLLRVTVCILGAEDNTGKTSGSGVLVAWSIFLFLSCTGGWN